MNRPPRKSSSNRRPRSRPARSVEPAEALHPTEDPPDIPTFHHWDLGDDIQAAIAGMGIESPTPIQALAIGPVLDGRDVIAKAETGTGKTLAFGAPMMARMDPQRSSVLALVMCPTRELSEQVYRVLEELGKAKGLGVALIVGGEEMRPQVEALHAGAQVVVGTPGRILDLMNQRFLSFPWTEFAVLDEADKMLEIGFIDDVRKILAAIPEERQTLLFSATFPPALLSLARESTRNPAEIATAKGLATVDTISQYFISVDEDRRPRVLSSLINASDPEDVFLVFCERRTDVDRLLRWMERERFPVKALHGGYDQASRFRVMSAFRDGQVKALLATDVASRGLDVNLVSHVINFAVPRDISDYTHRIGRTGRAGRTGTAITFVTPGDVRNWAAMLRGAPWDVEELAPGNLRPGLRGDREAGATTGSERSPRSGGRPERSERGPERERPERDDERPARSGRGPARGEARSGGRSGSRPEGRPEARTEVRTEVRTEQNGDRPARGRGRDDDRSSNDRGAPERRDRERSGRPDGRRERSHSGRDRGEERGGRERGAERKPERPQRDRHEEAPAKKGASGTFGLGIDDPAPKTSKRREQTPPPDKAPRKGSARREAASSRPAGDRGAPGFGAGL